jgi:hypothetical protein
LSKKYINIFVYINTVVELFILISQISPLAQTVKDDNHDTGDQLHLLYYKSEPKAAFNKSKKISNQTKSSEV